MVRIERILGVVVVLGLSSCASMNPYTQASKHMLQHYQATFCWAPANAGKSADACQNDTAAPVFNECLDKLRPTGHWWYPDEETADGKLTLCMEEKGWQRLFIKGVILG